MAATFFHYGSAKELLDDLRLKGLSDDLPINVLQIATMLGIRVVYSGFNFIDSVGKIEVDSDGQAVITINTLENSYEPRLRFTLAHEIAHYCLHLDKQRSFIDTKKCMSRSESYWDVYESEANTFAAQLLMPKDQIIKKGNEVASKYTLSSASSKIPTSIFTDLMANYFNVSTPAMEYRLRNLGII